MSALMSTQALAEYLDVPVPTIYKWRNLGLGPQAVRVGRHLRWRPEEVERWVDQQTAASSRVAREARARR